MEDGTTRNLGAVTFDGEELPGTNKDLTNIGNLSFTKDNTYIDFTFVFENISEVANYEAVLSFTDGYDGDGTVKHMNLQGRLDTTQTFTTLAANNLESITTIGVPANDSVTYILRVSLESKAKDAEFIGTMVWNLTATRI